MPDGIAGIPQLQQHIEIPVLRILETIVIIHELPRRSDTALPVTTMDDVNAFPLILAIRMVARVIDPYRMSPLHKARRKILRELLETSIRIGNTPRTQNTDPQTTARINLCQRMVSGNTSKKLVRRGFR